MTTRILLSMGLSALVLGGTMVGCSAGETGRGLASASNRKADLEAKAGAVNAHRAEVALARHDGGAAVYFAEAAVAMMPQSAAYRLLLAQGYLQAGRFTSARQGFADVLALSPADGKAALNLALTQIAGGDTQGARQTLERNASIIPPSDRGLALALAGDAGGAIGLLTEVARSSESNAKARQNLALALALAGQWQAARVVAAADLAPTEVDARLEQWARFAQPTTSYDQVAGLLGVRAVADAGQPAALALNRAPLMPTVSPIEALAAVERSARPVALAEAGSTPAPSRITFAAPREVVQALPGGTPTMLASRSEGAVLAARAQRGVRAISAGTGDWYVQIGAYDNAGVARAAWSQATRRFDGFSGRQPNGMAFRTNGEAYYRLSVGGFGRDEANQVCRRYRATGGACFVRQGAGDQMALWLRGGGVEVATR
ncbi:MULTISPECIES: SPOR domain-containing protein [unclassified Sphingomonas]|jgi:Flp pilus assembly protein TadD|uniref:SPOR domain-containing protein n=1 Tax=unclassified Sphingomonas TaxID=196159 RepID=UPI0004DFC9C8|nr:MULTISPECIES: SPOR domain-containing protein [unclassified Sphingomonas]MDY1008445.1 SPOR domain-containing protein [Sphingomonas sp. CFBP9019]